ncbi:hypothetical protein MB84_31500 (plasmid) [Pandoraea oxalativorans]|uniref:Uncharacterized protein n=1 Tax=Pandoraea oxalativorans TaxID=573737 RepID=A0A192B151_9BURK|nr:hypothetical protein MB84_31500 [Pandoraea oxalativorans]
MLERIADHPADHPADRLDGVPPGNVAQPLPDTAKIEPRSPTTLVRCVNNPIPGTHRVLMLQGRLRSGDFFRQA